jgi:multidrug efflux pump subunit AcrA (membrane-fusion protein)
MAKATPRFRKELPAAATETDGVPCVQVTDPATGSSFTFYEFEYDLAHQLDGTQDYDEVVAWAVANYQTALTNEAIDEFVAKLGELGFLDGVAAAGPHESAVGDSAQLEWNPGAGAPTAQFTPDAQMLAAGGAAKAAMRSSPSASSDQLKDIVESGAVQDAIAAATSAAVPQAIGGGLSGGATSRFAASSGNLSRGHSGERRQPPAPGDVVATPFEDVSMRFRAPPPERQRSSSGLVATLVTLAVLGGGGGYYMWLRQHPKAPEALRLRVVAPQPTAVYRWFATSGTVVDLDARSLSFESPGKLVELMPQGTKFAAGDVLGKLQGANALEDELGKHKSKLAVFEQMRDSMKASGKTANLRDVEDKITARKKMVDDVQASLNKVVLRAPEAGTIVETPVKVGAVVAAKAPALKWRGKNLHGDFTLDQEDFARASKLEFCRVEVAAGVGPGASPDAGAAVANAPGEPRFVDCTLPPPTPPPPGAPSLLRKFVVSLPADAGLVTGQALHLARKRYDGVFPLPLPAVQPITDVEAKVWVATPNGKAEQRTVTVAESRDEVLVSAGINVGDEVIVEPPHDLAPGTLVEPIR